MSGDDSVVDIGLLVYLLALLAAVFLGPLEAIAGMVGYWLIRPDDEPAAGGKRNTA